MAGYTKKYLYIYIAHGASMLLGMLSLFIVTPFVTSNKEVYGVYAICASLTIFFTYADIGFLGASQKFAAESYIRGDKKQEIEIMGFTCAILMSFLSLVSFGILILAYRPELLIKGLTSENYHVARNLLLILACSSPIFCFHRIVAVMFGVRLADYYYQIIQIISNLARIIIAPFFFMNGNYDIVGYYLSIQIISGLSLIISIYVANRSFSINFISILSNMKFRKSTYELLRGLAYTSLFGTICWVLYYELDNLVISKLLGAEAVAIYAIAFGILSVFRGLFSVVFGPYQTRYNYFIGENDVEGLNRYAKFQMLFFYPICVIPLLVLFFLSKPFVVSWVGWDYLESAEVLKYLLMCNILAFFSYPSSIYLTAFKKLNFLNISSSIIVVVYWVGVFFLFKQIGVCAFALMKATGMLASALFATIVVFKIMNESLVSFVLLILRRFLLPTFLCILMLRIIEPFMLLEKGRGYLVVNISIILGSGIISLLVFYLLSKDFRNEVNSFACQLATGKKG